MPEIKKYLSKDGLEDYNELLSDSATLVQDGGITTIKLADGSVTNSKLANDVIEAIEFSRAADALMGDPSESTWATRTSTGSGMARVESVQGAAVAWNQLIQLVNSVPPFTGITISTDPATGLVGFSGTASSSGGRNNYVATNIPLKSGHKYLIRDTLNYAASGNDTKWTFSDVSGSHPLVASMPTNEVYTYSGDDVTCWIGRSFNIGEVYDCSGYVSMYDLTTLYGAGNEPATVAEFERMYPEPYYPYSAPTLKSVQIAGISSTDANGGELDSVEWETQTLRAAGNVADVLYSDHVDVRVGVVDLGTLTWTTPVTGIFNAMVRDMATLVAYKVKSAAYAYATNSFNWVSTDSYADKSISTAGNNYIYVKDTSYTDIATFKAAMRGVLLFYEFATPTATPISPALPMSYRVEQGGTEAIIVPDGEISAAPVMTVAEGESAADLVMNALASIAAPDGPIAVTNHPINTYLTMSGKLYKVTTAIAAGETIAAGTNVIQTTVMDELIARTT